MSFKREEFYGENFRWYGVDKNGYLAEFLSSYAAIPSAVFADERKYEALVKFFKELPEITTSHLTPKAQLEQNVGYANYRWFTEKSEKGIYAFSDIIYTETYELISIPDEKLCVRDLPIHIQAFLEPLTFHTIDFETTKLLEITLLIKCDG